MDVEDNEGEEEEGDTTIINGLCPCPSGWTLYQTCAFTILQALIATTARHIVGIMRQGEVKAEDRKQEEK